MKKEQNILIDFPKAIGGGEVKCRKILAARLMIANPFELAPLAGSQKGRRRCIAGHGWNRKWVFSRPKKVGL